MLAALAAVVAAAAPAPTPAASPAPRTEAVGCRSQSGAGFPHAFAARSSLVIGPLAFVGLRDMRETTPENIAQHGGWKSPALVRPGHTVTVSIDRAARSFARLRYSHHGERPFARLPHTVRFVACDAAHADSTVDGRPVTFWSGFFELRRAPACVPVTIRVDGGPARHRRLPVAHGACSSPPASMRA
jgi:hypothetical protein